jgi:hypothetical protein
VTFRSLSFMKVLPGIFFINDFNPFLCPMVLAVRYKYKAYRFRKLDKNTKIPTLYKTVYLRTDKGENVPVNELKFALINSGHDAIIINNNKNKFVEFGFIIQQALVTISVE